MRRNQLNYSFALIISILTLFLLTSCGAVVKSKSSKYLTEDNGAIPPDFGKEKTTLLFITHHRSYNKYLKKNVKNIYKGEYEFITEEEFKSNSENLNIDKYRFVFDYNYVSPGGFTTKIDGTMGAPNYNVKKFRILDRKEQKEYISKLTSSYWSKLQKIYLEKLNEKLITLSN